MISMCRELDIATIAEKIETEDQARALLELGVGYGQGYLFGRPTLTPTGATG
jgi:EAL domain-containing protein (putative c-di-GMP-specific phosphodiesterase class I)